MFEAAKQKRKRKEILDALAEFKNQYADYARDVELISNCADVLGGWAKGNQKPVSGISCSLVETRVQGAMVGAGASMPINIAGIRFHVGGAAPVKREVMTVIDEGEFTIGRESAHFIGGRQSRKWDYKNVLGYDSDASNELLIAVSNRQKMSGVRYPASMDAALEALFVGAVELFRGNTQAVADWCNDAAADLTARGDKFSENATATLNRLSGELQALGVSEEDADAFVMSNWEGGGRLTVTE